MISARAANFLAAAKILAFPMISLVVLLSFGTLISFTSGHLKSSGDDDDDWRSNLQTRVSTLEEINSEVPQGDKDGLYYLIITMFVLSTVAATLLTATFLVLSVLLWGHFKTMKFFWFLTQLTLSVFILSSLNLVINVPATLFSMITKDFVQSDMFLFISYLIDICHYTILFSNLVIALQRFFVFFLRHISDTVFESPFIYAWLTTIWLAAGLVVFVMMTNNCRYRYKALEQHYVLYCEPKSLLVDLPPPALVKTMEITLQFGIPLVIFAIYIALTVKILTMKRSVLNKTETSILKQAFIIFIFFQISSLVFIFCQTLTFKPATAFLIKRVINTMEIFAGAATPCFFFFTSKDIKKLISTKVSAASSQSNSQVLARRQTRSM